jgi:outer membrane murein-binding lipoprotein Lpp
VGQHFGLSETNELTTLGEYFMNLTTTLKASIAAACLIAFAGCTDLKPIQAQIDDLKSQVSKLQSDTAKAASDAAAANSAAASAASAASGAQSTANQALSLAQQNATAIEAINEKIDRMFKKSVSK